MAENVTYNSPDGAVVGSSPTEKVAFYGNTPVGQGVAIPPGTDLATTIIAQAALIAQLQTYGLLA